MQRETATQLGVAGPGASSKQILFGDLHVHTSFSPDAFTQGLPLSGGTGSHTISDACDFARFCSNLDFWSVNDHAEGSTPRRWRETIEAIGRCDAVFDAEAPGAERDLISFVGFEWSHMGTTAENHFGHRNVILRDLDPERLPTRPIAADSPARSFGSTPTMLLGLLPVVAGDLAYLRYASYVQETDAVARCASGVPVRELPDDCREYAATPGELLSRLADWGYPSLVIPHGTTWGMYTPQGSAYTKQLRADWLDPVRQRLVEIYSGHGNTEAYRDWRSVVIDSDGKRRCPPPSDDYVPGCWQAGEIIRSRCLAEGLDAALCDGRAALTRQRYAEAPAGMGHLSVPGWTPEEWGDSGQCRDCFLPAFAYRPQSSVQAMLALSREGTDGAEPLRFRFGFVGASDTHTARPGSGYKEVARTAMTDVRLSRVDLPIPSPEDAPDAESRVHDARRFFDVGIDNFDRAPLCCRCQHFGDRRRMAYHHGNLREALLDRAAEIIAERGVEALSLRGLARDLGVSHAAPSRHFADRGALLAELAKDGFRRSAEAMARGAEAAGADPVARYRALGRSYVRFACENPSYFRALNHPEVRALIDDELRDVQREWMSTLRDGAAAAQRSGWHPEADPEALVAFSVAAAMGAATLFGDASWRELLDGDDLEGLADDVLDLIVHRSRTSAIDSTHETGKISDRDASRDPHPDHTRRAS